ncbi:hypothetical protein PHIM7_231 [Sinorhizobium phage phiM7]|uniref:Uncharacterized protein n=2 Tax=Emdodecavirus TaxID=1980937 RepID=S5M7A7_9CAUD|nr:hypothetical protein AB690_gp275 [Sinorhizobium phage phiM12]YP_009601356.1 hypothetical protein FDH46_gp247 [Sinorhizobium phage phiM7]AGR47941.2 hypothetical protein SmphiM12_309 [Sinorhizobium phage phiM12]AKF12776.1 hypothetical protein PHIM7_231 [Sinorhizobium phage phiM7]AKF13137.1 hypothetical protein PHIM19_232 [Sinorhizobium phage phiM19]
MTVEFLDLDQLQGEHILNTAPVWTTAKDTYGDENDVMAIGISGYTYVFTENSCDGYRSYMNQVERYPGLNTEYLKGAAPINRKASITYDDGSNKGYPRNNDPDDLIHITDVATGHHWGTLGTRAVSDYYPTCIMDWHPLDPSKMIDFKFKNIDDRSAHALAEAFHYDEVTIQARRGDTAYVATFRKDK